MKSDKVARGMSQRILAVYERR